MRGQHFSALTGGLKAARPEGGVKLEQWEQDVQTVAKVYDKLFPRFSREKFLEACGVEVDKAQVKGVRTRMVRQFITTSTRLEQRIAELEKLLKRQDDEGEPKT